LFNRGTKNGATPTGSEPACRQAGIFVTKSKRKIDRHKYLITYVQLLIYQKRGKLQEKSKYGCKEIKSSFN